MSTLPPRRLALSLFVLLVVLPLGGAILQQSLPISQHAGWVANVLNNWEEYGYFHLRGKLVQNPGGIEPGEAWDIYPGGTPLNLSVAVPYFLGLPFGAPGQFELPHYLLVAEIAALGFWWLLGRDLRAAFAAALLALTPGFVRFLAWVEPLAIVVLIGIAVGAFALRTLLRPWASRGSLLLVLFALFAYTLNGWAIVYALVPSGLALLVLLRPFRWKPVLVLASVIPFFLFVTWLGLHGKATSAHRASFIEAWSHFYHAYLWGSGGYCGFPMDWPKALVRIGVQNAVALSPAVVLAGAALYRARAVGTVHLLVALVPALSALVLVLGMRNYYAHWPWSASHIFLSGLVFSLFLLDRLARGLGVSAVLPPSGLLAAGVLLTFGYTLVLVAFLRLNGMEQDSLLNLVQKHTSRHDYLLIEPHADARLANLVRRIEDMVDRKVRLASGTERDLPPARRAFWLTTHQQAGAAPVGLSEVPHMAAEPILLPILDVYRRLMRRTPGDIMDCPFPLYLYEVRALSAPVPLSPAP